MRPLVCDWDATSTKPGTSYNGDVWREVLAGVPGVEPAVVLNRRLGDLIPAALTASTLAALDAGEIPLLLGGDHRLTYSVLNAIVHRVGRVLVHQFDAHHDMHPSPTLNNYSIFRYATQRLGIQLIRHGCREDRIPDTIPAAAAIPGVPPAAAYISVDLDYLDPNELPCVAFPVTVPEGHRYTMDTLTATVDRIPTDLPLIGCDVVEWCARDASGRDREVVRGIVCALVHAVRRSGTKAVA